MNNRSQIILNTVYSSNVLKYTHWRADIVSLHEICDQLKFVWLLFEHIYLSIIKSSTCRNRSFQRISVADCYVLAAGYGWYASFKLTCARIMLFNHSWTCCFCLSLPDLSRPTAIHESCFLDVISLYSNIPFYLVVSSIRHNWNKNKDSSNIPLEHFLEIVVFIFVNNSFAYR